MRDSLPLLEWTPPRQVLLFPLTNRVGKVRHTAEMLSRKHGEDADLYWKQVAAGIRRHLDRVGIPKDEAEAEIRAFFDAVQTELIRQSYEGPRAGRQPGGDPA